MDAAGNQISGSRVQHLDLLKGMAVIAMIQVHLSELFAVPGWQESLGGRISLFLGGPAAAPLFMVIMGYLAGKGNKKPSGLVLRGAKLMLWGLLLNIGLNFHLLLRIFFDGWANNPWHFVLGVDILFLAGLSLMLIALARLTGKLEIPATLAMIAAIVLAGYQKPWSGAGENLSEYLMAFVYSTASWSYFPLVPWAVYPLAGFVAAKVFVFRHIRFNTEKANWLVALSGAVLLAATFSIGWDAATQLDQWYHHDARVIAWNLVFAATLSAAANLMVMAYGGGPTVAFLSWTGRNVTAFYVFQWLLIGNISTSIYQTRYPLQLLVWFLVITAASAGLVWLYLRLKSMFRMQNRVLDGKS